MLFVLVDNQNGAIKTAWLVPSVDFDRLHGRPTTRGNFRFSASTKEVTRDQWSHSGSQRVNCREDHEPT